MSLTAHWGNAQVTLDWLAPASDGGASITGYRIYRSLVPGTEGTLLVTISSTSHVDGQLTNGQTYYYRVSAVNSAGEGAKTGERAATPHIPSPPTGDVTVSFIDVGQGDSILIETPDSKHVLIDAGSEGADSTIISFLQGRSVTTLDALIITHPDADHLGGADEVLGSFAVLRIYHSGFVKDTVAYTNFIAAADSEDCPIYTDAQIDPGDMLPLSSSVTFQVMAVDGDAPDANSASIVIKMSYGTVDFLFEGDAPSSVESAMIANPSLNLDVEILKVGHHGSSYSTSDAFLAATTPNVGVICVGAGNPYGHPTQQTLSRLAAHGVAVYRTDLDGTVQVVSDGSTWNVT
jgi:beta-lactamase superfamily II metal-dependent hydrolase